MDELYRAESKVQVYGSVHSLLFSIPAHTSGISMLRMYSPKVSEAYFTFVHSVEFICYDDGCHLRKFSRNLVRSTLTDITVYIAKIEIVLDRFLFPDHNDDWCKKTCNPDNFMELHEEI